MKTKFLTAALLLAAMAAPAFAANQTCLQRNQIDGWGARDDHSMIVNDIFGKKYLLTLAGLCSDINFSMGVGIRSLGPTNGTSCVDRGDHIVMRGVGVMPHNDTCWIQKIEPYTPAMEKADKAAREARHNGG
ncbi:MAG: hypothetical protein KGJ78_01745 [Alphaproteobacteria bacterium]|nr:hypothetical protein [Alphaproteobacteria bacterium]